MKLLLFNTRTRLIGETDISKGTVNASLVSPRELFIEALQKNAVSIILLHNHPSGDPTPSQPDPGDHQTGDGCRGADRNSVVGSYHYWRE